MARRAVTLAELEQELLKGRVYECSIRSDRLQVDGLQSGENCYVDPRPATLETLLHELAHRRYPNWSERTVEITARNLVVTMDEPTKARWWRMYRRIKRKGPPLDVHEDD